MEPIDIGLAVTGGMLVVVILGMRVAFAAATAGLVGLIWIFWSKKGYAGNEFLWALTVAVKTAGQVPHSKVSSQALSLIPTFIMIGYLAYYAGLTKALFEAAKRWIAWVPGGLAVSTVFASAGFAAVSGASVATAAVFARIAIPEMLKIGYDKRFAAGVVAAGGTLASLIPPSALLETAKLSVMIFTIIWGVLIYVRFLGFADLPSAFADWITSLTLSPMLILICILLAYAVLGMFMDAIGMLLLTLPVVYPAVMALNGGAMVSAADSTFGMSGPMCAVWFGILVVKMAEFCLITPPIGLNCFVVAGVRDDLNVQDVFKGVMPFFIADGITIGLLVAFPAIVLWLPGQV